jgi:heme/copper-type cytochrome/quinol oxidase subunit 4
MMQMLASNLAYARSQRYVLHFVSSVVVVAIALLSLMAIEGVLRSSSNDLVAYSLTNLPSGDRTLTISSNQVLVSHTDYQTVTKYLEKDFARLTSGMVSREVLYHALSDLHGVGFYLGAVDSLEHQVKLTSGRLPTSCTPVRCEVVQIGGSPSTPPQLASLGLAIVGNGVFANSQFFKGTFATAQGAPVLVANGIAALTSLPSLSSLQGSDGWVGNVNLKLLERLGANSYLDSVLIFSNQLSIDQSDLTLTWPQDALDEANAKAHDLFVKFDLLSYIVAALFVIFFVLFSFRQKAKHFQFRSGLSRIGTPKRILMEELLVEYAVPLIVGSAFAMLVSPVLPYLLSAQHFRASLSDVYQGWPKYVLILLITLALTTGFAIKGDRSWARRVWIPFVLAIALTSVYFLEVGWRSTGTWHSPLHYVLFSALAIAALIVSSLMLWWLGLLRRTKSTHTYLLFRENLGMWQGVSSILTLTTVLAVTALSLNSGVSRDLNLKSQDQVPLDVSIKTGTALARPFDVASISDYQDLLPNSAAYPVLRTDSAVRDQSSVSDSISLIGVVPTALSKSIDQTLHPLSRLLESTNAWSEPGVGLGSGTALAVNLMNIPNEVDLFAWLKTPQGTHTRLPFKGMGAQRTLSLRNALPHGSTLVAFEFRENDDHLARRLHATGEASFRNLPALTGTGGILQVTLDGAVLSFPDQVWNVRNFSYAFNGQSLIFRPKGNLPIPNAIVDSMTAALAQHGIVTLSGGLDTTFRVRVASVRTNFPSADTRFVIMNLAQLQGQISQTNPGGFDPVEVWISTKHPDQYRDRVEHSPFGNLVVQTRIDAFARLSADPTNRGSNEAYKIALLFALLIAIFMHGTSLPLLYKENKNLLLQLEFGGVGPNSLRVALRNSLRWTLLVGALFGLSLGLLLTHLSISRSTPYLVILLTFCSVVLVSESAGYLFTHRLFREPALVRS